MIRDITIGQYYRTDSILHKLDPRVKIIGTFIYMIALFVFAKISFYLLAGIVLFVVIKMSKVPFSFMVKGLKTIVILLMFTIICQLFMTKGTEVICNIYSLKIYKEGLYNATLLGVRIIFLIMGSSIMTFTTTPNELTDGFESVMKPLGLFKIDVHDIAMMMSIALRYIPILLEETDKIMKAQMARGADFETGGLIKKVKNMVPLIIPLFVAAFRRAAELALAMEARCYRGGKDRTKMKPLKYCRRDIIAYMCMLAFVITNVVLKIMKISF